MDDLNPTLLSREDQEKEERVKLLVPLARDVVLVVTKTIKATRLYLPNNPIYKRFREELKDKLDAFFEHEELLSFMVKRFELTFLDQVVYQNPDKEDNFALMFFKDGVREFCFQRGINSVELDAFIDILKFDQQARELDDDLVTLLWEKDFERISYTVAEESTDEEAAEEDEMLSFKDEPEAIRVLDELRERASREARTAADQLAESAAAADAGIGQAALETGTEESAGSGGGKMHFLGAASGGVDYEIMRGTFHPPDDLSLLTELTDIFYEILITERDPESFELVTASLTRALEIFVGRGDMALATILVMKMQELVVHPDLEQWRTKIDEVLAKAASPVLVRKVGEFIDQGGQEAVEAAGSYLSQLDARALPTTVSLLETVENRKARKALCDIIMMQSGGRGKLLVPFLSHKMWFVARNIVMIMGKLADQDTILALGQAMRNPDPRVRREVVSALYTLKGKRVEEFLSDAVSDEDRQVRVLAGRLLGELAPDKAFERLIRVFIGPNFGELELEEMRDVSEQLGKAGGEKAIPSLAAVFRKKGLFASGKREKMRIAAAYGLAAAGGEQAREMLESETGSKNDLLRRACVEGLRTIKLRGGR